MMTIPVLYDTNAKPRAANPSRDDSAVSPRLSETRNPYQIGTVKSPQWMDPEQKQCIRCIVTFPNHPMGMTDPVVFSAMPTDVEAHGRELFARLVAGEFGPIADFAEDIGTRSRQAREKRDELLATTQWLVDRHRDERDGGVPTTLSADLFAALQAYRRALRSITEQPEFPASINWPVSPL